MSRPPEWDIELIVVDDGSTDERTRKEMDALPAQGIKVIRQENKGLAAARNAGIAISRGEYILPLDADDRLRSGWIDRGIRILDSNPQVGVVYGDAQCFGTRNDRWTIGPFDPDRLLQWNYIHASALYRRSVWEQNRGYDGTMPVQGYEDWDFWLGALEHGWEFAYVPRGVFRLSTSRAIDDHSHPWIRIADRGVHCEQARPSLSAAVAAAKARARICERDLSRYRKMAQISIWRDIRNSPAKDGEGAAIDSAAI